MKKQQRQMLILLIVLVALLALFFGVKQYNKIQAQKPAEEEEMITVIDAAGEDIIKLIYDYDGETYTFEKKEDTWYAAEDASLNIKQTRLTNMVGALTPLEATQKIEDVSDFSQYGLEEPQRTITVETAEKSDILYVGDKNELTSSYYVCLPGETVVYTVSSSDISRFNYALADLIEEEEEESTDEAESASEAEGGDGSESAKGGDEIAAGDDSESAEGTDAGEAAGETGAGDGSESAEGADAGEAAGETGAGDEAGSTEAE